MKKMIVLVGFLFAFGLKAETYDRTLVEGYTQVPGMDCAFEIQTPKFQKVILDCQSFITGINFYNDKKVVHSIYLDAYGDCQNTFDFISTSLGQNKPVCLEIATDTKTLTISNDGDGCQ